MASTGTSPVIGQSGVGAELRVGAHTMLPLTAPTTKGGLPGTGCTASIPL